MQPGANRTDIVADPSKTPGQLPADAHGQQAARAEAAAALPVARQAPGPLVHKTRRPDEPVTAGLPVGLGPGPSGPAAMNSNERAIARLRVAAARSSSPALHRALRRLGG